MNFELPCGLKAGDPVTVLHVTFNRGPEMVVLSATARVTGPRSRVKGFFDVFAASPINFTLTRSDDQEGIFWIRGHHEDESAAVQAMRAARALLYG